MITHLFICSLEAYTPHKYTHFSTISFKNIIYIPQHPVNIEAYYV